MSYSSHPMLRRYYAINEHLGSFSYEDLTQRISDLEAQLAARPRPARDNSERVKNLIKKLDDVPDTCGEEDRKKALKHKQANKRLRKENILLGEQIQRLKDKLAECKTEKKTCEEAKQNMQQELQELLQRLVEATVVAVDPPTNVVAVPVTVTATKLQEDTIQRMQSTVNEIPQAQKAGMFEKLRKWFLRGGKFPVAVPAAPAK